VKPISVEDCLRPWIERIDRLRAGQVEFLAETRGHGHLDDILNQRLLLNDLAPEFSRPLTERGILVYFTRLYAGPTGGPTKPATLAIDFEVGRYAVLHYRDGEWG
jgi:hypothetical protein